MSYSQKPLIEAFLAGHVPGELEVPQHIETVISNVFVFNETVYKLYKNDSEFFNTSFNDLSTKEARFTFTREDFSWNNTVTPTVYTNLIGVSLIDGSIAVGEPTDEATELVIVMNRMNMDDVLFERLMRNGVSLDEAYQLGKSSAENLARIRKSPAPDLNYYQESGDRIADLYNWLASSTEEFEKGETERYMNFLEQYRVEHKEHFMDVLSTELEFGGDIHSHNALVTGNELLLMDTFSPKAAWRVEHHSVPAYRLATDLWALGGTKEHFDRFLQGYQEVSGKIIDRALDAFFTVYASLIAVPYHYMLAKNDVSKRVAAERFHTFLRNYFSKI